MALFGIGRLPLAQYWNESHNLKVVGSNPTPATKRNPRKQRCFRGFSIPETKPLFHAGNRMGITRDTKIGSQWRCTGVRSVSKWKLEQTQYRSVDRLGQAGASAT